jgi:alpha,alpha-trehalose phosphorylase
MNSTSSFDAVLFDLDGVLTSTAAIHATAWKRTFDALLAHWGQEPFDLERDYLDHVDGKPRASGIRDFLGSRGIALDDASVQTIAGRKQAHFERALDRCGVEAFPGSVRWVRHLRALGLWTAVVSSSANTDRVLRAAEITELFDLTIDAHDVRELGLQGKPAPDGFLEAARRLDVTPRRAVVVEDALVGVAAGRAGDFGLVIGVTRGAGASKLRAAGADVVVADLEELVP